MVTIDASVWLAADAADEAARDVSRSFLRAVLAGGLAVHLPSISIVEVAAAVARRTGDADLAREAGQRVLEMPALVVHPLDIDAAAEAAALAGYVRLRAADAIYAATALRLGTQLVTLDLELRDRAAPVVGVFTPAEWLESRSIV
ncbi:MAG: PIN domain-containing protein [Chloroflexota bacterium]|nr:PIN domain-containing protein [Chloroflexota bacterium]